MEKKRHGKSIARETCFKSLYTYAITKDKNLAYSNDNLANKMLDGVVENEEDINKLITANLKKWKISQLNPVNLAILQLTIYEINYMQTPVNIVVNEGLELAKKYSDIKSKNFIHATLSKITKG